MFWFLDSRPPLMTSQRVDLELLMRKTIETIGTKTIEQAVVVTDISQLQLDQSEPAELLNSAASEVALRMGMACTDVALATEAESAHGFASRYELASGGAPATIFVASETLADPLRTVMELAYQYAFHYWRIRNEPTELELHPKTTSLLPICCGLGLLASDASLVDKQWSQSGFSGWSMSRSGYYNAEEIGYAMALWARVRKEPKPSWARHLRLDSQVTAKKAWRYFSSHENAGGRLLLDAAKIPATARDMSELADWLRGEDPAFALAAAYALRKMPELSPLAIEAAMQATHGEDVSLAPAATRLLGLARNSSAEIESRVQQLIQDQSPFTRLFALESAADLGMSLAPFHGKIVELLSVFQNDPWTLLDLIGNSGADMKLLGPQLCDHLSHAIQMKRSELTEAIIQCLEKVDENAGQLIKSHVKPLEIQRQALECLTIADS